MNSFSSLYPLKSKKGLSQRHLVYLMGFITGISVALLAYIQSSFLTSLVDEKYIGLIYTTSSVITLIFINYFIQIINKLSNKTTAIFAVLATIASLLIMADGFSVTTTLLSFIIYLITITLIYINTDIFLESVSKDEDTGKIRGIYFTLASIGWVITPVGAGWLLEQFGFSFMFTLSAFFFGILLLIITFGFKKSKERRYRHPSFLATLKEIWRRTELRNIFMVAIILYFFYAWMAIYMPIYLHDVMNLSWPNIGLVFTIMLIPFILIEYPAGFLADKYWGEKEMLIAGMLIMSVFSFLLFFIESKSIIIWASALFLTRIGASLIEIMKDTYFFKQINASDIHLINFFRNTMPLAYIIAPALASGILVFFDFKFLFPALGAIIFFGSYFAFAIRDTN